MATGNDDNPQTSSPQQTPQSPPPSPPLGSDIEESEKNKSYTSSAGPAPAIP